ncbi:MAG: HU family DNA-binding protein [Bacteroidaceae bacterium]|nr:HU family DNA-binding protein [Bacteroidaceae bacterium]
MGKITLSNIAEELAAKSKITREAADSFMHAFIASIDKGLQEDSMVKVKGLGTFKLLEVSDRSSVDVNTGDRITIKGYRKVSFTPDSAMKELVNRPFAHFEPTELNDGYPTEEEAIEDTATTDTATEEKAAEETVPTEEVNKEETIADKAVEGVEEAETLRTETKCEIIQDERESTKQQNTGQRSQTVCEETKREEAQPKQRRKKRHAYVWTVILLLMTMATGAYYHYATVSLAEKQSSDEEKGQSSMIIKPNLQEELGMEWEESPKEQSLPPMEEQGTTAPKEQGDSTEPTVPTAQDRGNQALEKERLTAETPPPLVPITKDLQNKSLKDITPADTTDYRIAGTLVTHELRNGETIIYLTKKYYGDKRLWPYIVKHNQMNDFNNVAIGQMINIPILEKKP